MGSRGGDKAPPRNDLLKSVQEVVAYVATASKSRKSPVVPKIVPMRVIVDTR